MSFTWKKESSDTYERYDLSEMDGGSRITGISVYPGMGFKCAGFSFGGESYAPDEDHWSPYLRGMISFGSPVMYPTPNRVRDNTFVFQGQKVQMQKDGKPHAQHGILYDAAIECETPEIFEDHIAIRGYVRMREGDELYEIFPYENDLVLEYRLYHDALEFSYEVTNRGRKDMPFGIGLHTAFTAKKTADRVLLDLRTDRMYETTADLLPTGKLIKLEPADPFYAADGANIDGLKLDTAYLTEGGDMYITYPDRAAEIRITTSEDFGIAVVYTPSSMGLIPEAPEKLFFVESQTSATDAINLYESGSKISGLQILKSEEQASGYIRYAWSKEA